MDKIKGILITVLLFVAIVAMFLITYRLYRQQKVECERLQSNIEALHGEIERGFSRDNHTTATIKQQTLTKSELKEIIHEELKSLNIKERDVKQVIVTSEETKANVAIDTIIIKDSTPEYRYTDRWVDLRVDGDSAHILVHDSILIVNHARTRRFLWWTWKRYSGKTTIKNYSPYSEIKSVTSIDVEQKRK